MGKLLLAFAVVGMATATCGAQVSIAVDPSREVGVIKPMNAVNNGPTVAKKGGDQSHGNFDAYRKMRTPFARLHDSINCVSGGAHTVDISAVFPDFEADENDPKSYDFIFTDHYLDTISRAGTGIFYRLGETIEHGPKKYNIYPPKDFSKWARICEHIIRHYNEGWGWDDPDIPYHDQFRIVYWEIWGEPDLDVAGERWKTAPRLWGGSESEFQRLYATAAVHLKKKFPKLKIGGPGLATDLEWADRFLAYCRDNRVPLDFFSWHLYCQNPLAHVIRADKVHELLVKHGFDKTESILDEHCYIKNWQGSYAFSIDSLSGHESQRGAAHLASVMAMCQNHPVDMVMYYDARPTCLLNTLFDLSSRRPKQGYFAVYGWSRLRDYGTQVKATATGDEEVSAIAARDASGAVALFISRFSVDNNVTDPEKYVVSVPGKDLSKAVCHVTDRDFLFTEQPLSIADDGSAYIWAQPNSFMLIECK